MANNAALHMDYEIGGYLLKNYIHCDHNEHKKILQVRNSDFVRLQSLHQEIISPEAHISFVEGLKARQDSAYWLIYKEEAAFGSLSLSSVSSLSAEVGLFKFQENSTKHAGRNIVKLACELAFEKMGLAKLTAECFTQNPASWRSFEAVGFKLTDSDKNMRFYEKERQ